MCETYILYFPQQSNNFCHYLHLQGGAPEDPEDQRDDQENSKCTYG